MPHLPKKLLLYSFFPIIVTQLTPVYFGRSNGTTTNISSTFTQYIQGRWCSQTMVYNQPYTARTDGRWCPVFVGFDVPSSDRAHSFSLAVVCCTERQSVSVQCLGMAEYGMDCLSYVVVCAPVPEDSPRVACAVLQPQQPRRRRRMFSRFRLYSEWYSE